MVFNLFDQLVSKLNSWPFFLALLLGGVLTLEGLSLPLGREISYYLILLVPSLFLIINFRLSIRLPRVVLILTSLFLGFGFVSSLLSVEVGQAMERWVFVLALLLILIITLSQKQLINHLANKLVLIFSIIFIVVTILLNIADRLNWPTFLNNHAYQFIYPQHSSHNHLGDFLALGIGLSLVRFFQTQSRRYLILIFGFLPFFLFAYSRSAYVALGVALVTWAHFWPIRRFGRKLFLSLMGLLLSLSILFTFATVQEAKQIPFLNQIHQVLTEKFQLSDKFFRSKRIELADQAFMSILQTPLLGIGPGNFILASQQYSQVFRFFSESSHNLFLDIATEQGLIATFIFLILITMAIVSNLKQKPVELFVFIILLINFQFDYTFLTYSLITLFFVYLGILFQPLNFFPNRQFFKNNFLLPFKQINLPRIFPLLISLGIMTFLGLKLTSQIFLLQNQPAQALIVYPLNKKAAELVIVGYQKEGAHQKTLDQLKRYTLFHRGNFQSLYFMAQNYEKLSLNQQALEFYKKAYSAYPYQSTQIVGKIVKLSRLLKHESAAHQFWNQFLTDLGDVKDKNNIPPAYLKAILVICEQEKLPCPSDTI